MSFRCERCNKAQEPRTRPNRVVTIVRELENSWGSQIVKEENLCDECEATYQGPTVLTANRPAWLRHKMEIAQSA